ncbi:hypothetical protein Pmani_018512 [Petrolisthes manimaculis]|uniref:Uncharacterized protein n=1 Tax=Petrolisthes manimaculis TaxID=1843537 RepID=A0AAE1U6L9_9EUCA|nr:hypothetical protein Pmani_018512 [Petrolisthes manimaculis]
MLHAQFPVFLLSLPHEHLTTWQLAPEIPRVARQETTKAGTATDVTILTRNDPGSLMTTLRTSRPTWLLL